MFQATIYSFGKRDSVLPIVYNILSKVKHNFRVSVYKFAANRYSEKGWN